MGFEQFDRAARYFEYLTWRLNEDIKLNKNTDCFACGDVIGIKEKKAADLDGNMKLFRYHSSNG